MGRPPLNLKDFHINLSEDVVKRIDALVGPNRRAIFIRDAVDREVRRRERKALKGRERVKT
jgi:metal-responsive CopG/Arc/MetJ family transcriptional regulator